MSLKNKFFIGILVVWVVLIGGRGVWSDLSKIEEPRSASLEEKEIVEVTGRIRMIGNEPFTQLAIENLDGEVYGIIGGKTNELKKLQGQKVKVKASLMGRTPPSFRTEKSINVIDFELVKAEVTITTDKTEYEQGEIVKISIKNISDKEMIICGPFCTVERFDNGEWIRIKRVLCRCETYCKAAAYFSLYPGKTIELEWNQMESWCVPRDPESSDFGPRNSKTIYRQVPTGKYRVKRRISNIREGCRMDLEDIYFKIIYSNEFTIKEK